MAVKQITKYKTSDGKEFDLESQALTWEKLGELKQELYGLIQEFWWEDMDRGSLSNELYLNRKEIIAILTKMEKLL